MNNYSQYSGGGINCMDASPVITHNIIAGNMAYLTGGALACPINAYPVLINNTIVNNTAENPGGGIYCSDATANPIVLNCIFWNNSPEQICGSASVVAYSNVQGGWQGENNIDVNPLFVDPESDFHLQENSPCIDAGTAYFELNGEIILDLHPDEYIGEAPDMGAVEYDPESAILPAQYEITTPPKVTLHSAYPNPFNPQTTIQFDVPVASQVNLQIYNAQGQLVRTLANNQKEAGHHRVIWNGKDEQGKSVESGLYFYKLTVDNKYSDVKPMTLLK
jgi:predicted outer membrane repeat protein